jgi:hypothetical protein
MLELEIHAKRRGGRVRFGIKLNWREYEEDPNAEPLEIKAGPRT